MDVDKFSENKITRKSFIDILLGGTVFATLLSGISIVGIYLWPRQKVGNGGADEAVEVGLESDMPVGKAKVVPYGGKTAIVINAKTGLVALSAVCTHLGCVVKWDEQKQQIVCPCHGAFFDTNGNVVAGPAPKPLPSYKLKVMNKKIYIGGA